MDLQSIFIIINILVTIFVGIILKRQIKSQNTLLSHYKDFISAIDPNKALALKDEEIKQIKLLLGNDIDLLKTQIGELSYYTNEILNNMEAIKKDIDTENELPSKESTINNYMPNCKSIFNSYE